MRRPRRSTIITIDYNRYHYGRYNRYHYGRCRVRPLCSSPSLCWQVTNPRTLTPSHPHILPPSHPHTLPLSHSHTLTLMHATMAPLRSSRIDSMRAAAAAASPDASRVAKCPRRCSTPSRALPHGYQSLRSSPVGWGPLGKTATGMTSMCASATPR